MLCFQFETWCFPSLRHYSEDHRFFTHAVRRCRLTHQGDPGLKAIDFQLLELFESTSPFKVLVSTANLHPYIAGTSCVDYSNLNNGKKDLDDKAGAEVQSRPWLESTTWFQSLIVKNDK